MLDTVAIAGPWEARKPLPPGCFKHPDRPIRLRADRSGRFLLRAEASLPKLLFGHNGRVLANQRELDAGIEQLLGALQEFAVIPPISEISAQRADLAWNFDLPARRLITAYGHTRLPDVRRGPTRFADSTGVSWKGERSRFKLTLYDKACEARVAGSVLRVELSLCGHQLCQRLPGSGWRRMNTLRPAFRSVLLSLPPIPAAGEAKDWLEAVAMEPEEVIDRIFAGLQHKSERTRRRYAQRLSAASCHMERPFSWREHLPRNGLPPHVIVAQPDR